MVIEAAGLVPAKVDPQHFELRVKHGVNKGHFPDPQP